MPSVYKISIPNTPRDVYDYLAGDIAPPIGARVKIPFRHYTRVGIVVEVGEPATQTRKLKSILAVIDDAPLLSKSLLQLCLWVAQYYQAPLSTVLTTALPKLFREGRVMRYDLDPPVDPAVKPWEGGVEGSGPITRPTYDLHPGQQTAVSAVCDALHQYHAFLLQGVTGSGKTEVYMQIIEKVLASGRQALVLVPEIGLTPQLLDRFATRFGPDALLVVHSHLTDKTRFEAWCAAGSHSAKLIIGTRTAVFTPMPDLGLIVIDEEHDSSFKQMTGVRYSARDTALMRAYMQQIPVVLGSATPSLESAYNAAIEKYTLLPLTHKAMASHPLHYRIIDIRNKKLTHGLCENTLATMKTHLDDGKQVMVFINRRGFAPVWLCHQCGWMADCRDCDSHMTFHRDLNRLLCHHCGLSQPVISSCPSCQCDTFLPVGVGTQRLHTYLEKVFPGSAIVRLDRDTTAKKNSLQSHLADIQTGRAQLMVGTQMLAKGHHFPNLTLVVILDADAGLYHPDFRAMERMGQLLIQVAGRAGRAEHPGEVLIQTHLPHHPVLNTLVQQGYDAFSEDILDMRREAQLPPFQYLALIHAKGKEKALVSDFLDGIKTTLEKQHVTALGPAVPSLARKAKLYHLQLLIKAKSRKALQHTLTTLRHELEKKRIKGVKWGIDVDPIIS